MYMFFHSTECWIRSGSVVASQTHVRDIEGSTPGGGGVSAFFSFSRFTYNFPLHKYFSKEGALQLLKRQIYYKEISLGFLKTEKENIDSVRYQIFT